MNERWMYCYGSWGDVIIQLGYIERERPEAGPILYLGYHPDLAEWIASQPNVTRVEQARLWQNQEERTQAMSVIWSRSEFERLLRPHTEPLGFLPEQLPMIYPSPAQLKNSNDPIPIARKVRAGAAADAWAQQALAGVDDGFVLVQPFSINTNSLGEHWPYWHLLLPAIFRQSPDTQFVLCGRDWDDSEFLAFPNVRSLVGETPKVNCLYALAERASCVITTSNSLAHYCVCREIDSLVCAAYRSGSPNFFYSRVLRFPTVRYVGYTDNVYSAVFSSEQMISDCIRRLAHA